MHYCFLKFTQFPSCFRFCLTIDITRFQHLFVLIFADPAAIFPLIYTTLPISADSLNFIDIFYCIHAYRSYQINRGGSINS